MVSIGNLKREVTERYFRNTAFDLTEWRKQFDDDVSETVVNIPARSGSTRLKDKNIQDVCGLPLLAYTIKLAKAIPGVHRVIVNTDSPVYAEIARHYGAEVPFLRPLAFASSTASSYWAYYYLFRYLVDEDYPVKTIITLVPTSPFRHVGHLVHLLETLLRYGSVQSAFCVRTPATELYNNVDGKLQAVALCERDQMTFFKPVGMFTGQHVFSDHILKKYIDLITNPIELIDIDTEGDLLVMKQVVEGGLYDFGMSLCVK